MPKIKKIYVGTNLVRPSVQSASYNFKNLTWSTLSSQGWINATYSGGTFAMSNSMGIYSTSDGHVYAGCPINLSSASSITIKVVFYGYYGSWVGGNSFGLANSNLSSSTLPLTINYSCCNNSGYKAQEIYMSGTQKAVTQYGVPTGEHTLTAVMNLRTGALSYTLDNLVSLTATASSTELANIKNSSYIYVHVAYNGGKQHQCWSMEYTVNH